MAALLDYIAITIIVTLFRFRLPNVERPFKCPALFLIAPTALFTSLGLLFQQIIAKDGSILLTGKIIIYWFILVLILYILNTLLFKKNLE